MPNSINSIRTIALVGQAGHSERISALGVRFRVLDLPSLIKAKRAAGRPRDFDHLPELEALLALRKNQ